MIIVKLRGGLGNQMFQYAAARRLAYRHQTALKLDISSLASSQHGNTYRQYGLSVFSLVADIATPQEVRALCSRPYGLIGKCLNKLGLKCRLGISSTHILEKQIHFDPNILDLPDNVYLDGYWQSEQYFKEIADVIRKELTVKIPPTHENQEIAERILSCDSVSLHVRRGDYISDPKTKQFHGACDLAYYKWCIERLCKVVGTPHFFVFSDEPDWVRNNLFLPYPITYIAHNSSDPTMAYEDIRLMSLCTHHIIANSSFSWWGAWLGHNPEKTVYAPTQWFGEQNPRNKITDDLLPPSWLRC